MGVMDNHPPRFLCDEMLKGLARWLRTAGYDAQLSGNGVSDRVMLDQARTEGRLLLTRDHKLKEFRHASGTVVHLSCNQLDACARELIKTVNLNWCYRPFSRCLLCNTPLEPGTETAWARVPAKSREHAARVYRCPQCDKVYWDGSHTIRMRRRLRAWCHEKSAASRII